MQSNMLCRREKWKSSQVGSRKLPGDCVDDLGRKEVDLG
jgi:hypothetical protein